MVPGPEGANAGAGNLLGVPLWKPLAFLLYLVLAFYLARLVDYVLHAWLRRWARRTGTHLSDLLLASLHGPVKVVTFVLLLEAGWRLFGWPHEAVGLISLGLQIVLACALTYLALKGVDLVMVRWRQRLDAGEENALGLHLLPLLRNTLKIFVLVVAVLVASQNLGLNITGLLASLSIGGLAISLAAQDTLSNLFGAVAIFADKPFRLGDHIQLECVEGTVEAIGLRSTRVRNLEGFLVTVPNKTIASASIANISKRRGIRTVLDLGVTWDIPTPKIERALALINEVYRSHAKTADLLVSLNKFDGSALHIRVVHWWDSASLQEYLLGFQQLNLELKRRLEAEGISFGSPSQNVYLHREPLPRPVSKLAAPSATSRGGP